MNIISPLAKGDLVYIRKKTNDIDHGLSNWKDGFIMFYQDMVRGKDISIHGSPEYEIILIAEDMKTGETKRFSDQDYIWKNPIALINSLQRRIDDIRYQINKLLY